MQPKELFVQLSMLGLISQKDGAWELTEEGKKKGGIVKESKQYGPYITWPNDVDLNLTINEALITATAIGKHFDLSATKTNYILSELGWIKKSLKGWALTIQAQNWVVCRMKIRNQAFPLCAGRKPSLTQKHCWSRWPI